MPRPKRSRRAPFVLTVTAVVAASPAACGGSVETSDDGTAQGGTAGAGTGGTSASGGAGGSATGGTGGFGGFVNPPGFGGAGAVISVGGSSSGGVGGTAGSPNGACPPTRPSSFGPTPCALPPGETCTYVEHCQSGGVRFEYVCDGYFQLVPSDCAKPHDFCAGTGLWCPEGGPWMELYAGTNPPAPCPAERPVDGSSCVTGVFGGVMSPCGYPCGSNATWSIATCSPTDAGNGVWQTDGACE
jgi:hypothetical protein